MEKELANGEVGKGLWPFMPEKLHRVGVLGAEVCMDCGGGGWDDVAALWTGARGVVGVVASLEKSRNPSPALTDWNVVMMVLGSAMPALTAVCLCCS